MQNNLISFSASDLDEAKYHTDADYNAALGRAYLDKQLLDFGNDEAKALAAYNAGPGAVRRAIRRAEGAGQPDQWLTFLPTETQNYVPKILSRAGAEPVPTESVPPASTGAARPVQIKPRSDASAFDFAKELAASGIESIGSIGQFFGEAAAALANKLTKTEDYEGKNLLAPISQGIRNSMTEGGKQAREEGSVQGDIFDLASVELPQTARGWAMLTAQGLGSLASTLIPIVGPSARTAALARAAEAAKAAGDLAKAAKLAQQAKSAAGLSRTVGVASGGATTAGSAAGEVRANLDRAFIEMGHDRLMAEVPAYADVYNQTGDEAQARRAVINDAALAAGVLSGVFGAVGGAFNVKLLEDFLLKQGLARVAGQSTGSMVGRAAISGGVGSLAEGGQETAEKVGQNIGENIGKGRPALEGATRDTAGDAIGGLVVGGGVGAGFGAGARASSGGGESGASGPAGGAPGAAQPSQEPAQNAPIKADTQGPVEAAAARPNSPLSRAAVSGSAGQQHAVDARAARLAELDAKASGTPESTVTDDAGVRRRIPGQQPQFLTDSERAEREQLRDRTATQEEPRRQGAQQSLDERLQAAREAASEAGTLDALRSPGAPIDAKSFVRDLSVASSPSTSAHLREQAMTRVEMALGWAAQNRVGQPATSMSEVAGDYGRGVPEGERPSAPQLRDAVDRESALHEQLARASTEFERQQIRAQMGVNREMRMRAQPEPEPTTQEREPGIAPSEQAALEAAGLAGTVSRRRDEDEPRQVVINRAMRSIEERGGVASPAEAQIVFEAGLGRPYDRIDESLAPPAGPVVPRMSDSQAPSGIQVEQSNSRRDQGRLEGAQSSAELTPSQWPTATTSLGARAEREPGINPSPDDFGADRFSPQADGPGVSASAGRVPAMRMEPAHAEGAQSRVPALLRKRRETLAQLVDMGFTTVEHNADGFVLSNPATGATFALDGSVDAQLARAAVSSYVDDAAARADVSPTDAQKEAGNYRKGTPIQLNGVTVIIENPRNSVRKGVDEDGNHWESKLSHHYGYISRSTGADGDQVDVFIGPRPDSARIYVVDQLSPDGSFDEHKVLFGFTSEQGARAGYLKNYSAGWNGLGAITEMTQPEFKAWLKNESQRKPVSTNLDGALNARPNQQPVDRGGAGGRPAGGAAVLADGPRTGRADARGAGLVDRAPEPATRGAAVERVAAPDVRLGEDRLGEPVAPNRRRLTIQDRGQARTVTLLDDPTASGELSAEHVGVLRSIAEALGLRAEFFAADRAIGDGFVDDRFPGRIFLSTNPSINPIEVLGHELWHQLKRGGPRGAAAAAAIESALIDRGVDLSGFARYYDRSTNVAGRESVYLEELSADLFGTHFSDPSFWSEVFAAINDKHAQRESRGIIAELAARLLGVVDRALSLFRQGGFQSSRYVPQAQALRAAFRDALVGYIQDQEARPTAMKAELMRAVTRMNRSTERGGGAAGGQVDERALGVGAVAATLAAGNLDASVPHYGVPQRGSVSASAVHYSNDNRAHLDSAAYGRGLKGAERIRLEGVENADIRPRIFFYVDKGNGIRPEAGVGAYPHAVRLDNLYDIWSDPLDLRKNNPGANNWERAIMLAGFDGYLSLDPLLPQGFAILVGARHSAVPVSPTRVPTAAAVSAPAPTTVRRSLLSRELDAVDVSAIPGARMVSGSLVVPHSSIGEANLEMERIGSEVRFSAAREASEEETTSVRKYRLDIAREARSKVRRGNLSNEERNAIIADGEEMRLQKRQIRELIKKAREFKRRYPASAGWAPLTAAGITGDIDLETGSIAPGTERVKYKAIAYAFNTPPGKKRAPARIDQEWLGKVSSEFEKMILDVFDRAEKGDENAKTILSHQTWYRGVTESLRREYGGFGDLLADLLGATSPNTPVETNWNFSIDAMRRFLSGQFDSELTRLEQWIEAGNPVSSFADADKIRQASGKLYGINSGNAMLAMLDMWRIIRPGTAPKARNFALNLIGQSNMATIDVWAARMLRRAANAVKGASFPRIPPEAEVGVSGVWNASGDAVTGAFGFGASVMDRASESLKRKGLDISPPDLQAIAWFAEKELWATKGWTTIVGESGSFEEMIEQRPRDRYIAGWTIQQSEPPSDAEMSAAQKRVVDVLSSDPSVIASRVAPTIGLYGSYEERSFDTEWVADREEHDPTKAIREIAKIASENNQFDIFVSRVLRPEEQSPNARPGVEVYFRNQKSMEEARPILEAFTKRGQDGFTLTVDPRQRRDGYIGVRLQYVPEITARFDPVAASRRLLIPGGIERTLAGKTRAMDRIVAELSDLHGVAFAAVWQYDTVVFGRENYDEAIDRGTARADRQTGARVRLGESVRAELERAVARYAGERQQADAGRLHGADHAAQGGAQPQEGVAEGGDSWWGSDARLSRSRAEPPEGEYATRAELAVVRRQKLGAAGPIKDLGDAANALHYLIRSAVERVDVLVTSARGKPLAIIGGFKGELASSPVMPVTLLAEAVQVPGAANLWVVHNHPSGATDLSEADRALAITLSRQFDGTGIAVRGMIAVSKSGWGGVWVEGSRLSAIGEQAGRIAPVEGKTVPALERQLSSDGKLDDRSIYTAQAGREAALAAAGVYNSPVIIMLDMRHRALAVVPWSGKDAAQLKNNGKLDALLRAASTANAGRAIIALGDGMTKDQARNLATGLQRAGVTTLDIVDKSGNSSASVGEGLYADVLRSAHRYANSPEFQRWFEGSKVVDKSGRPLIVYHGTTHDISAFDVSVANVESDWGAGIYFTTSPVDASQNYAGLGPDLLSRVERLADTIAHERQITPEAALGVALTQLSGGAPNIIPAYLSMRNPFIVGGPGQTFLGHEYDPENEDAAPSGDLQRIIDAIYEVPDDIIDFDPDALVAEISQAALDDGGLTAEDLDAVLRASSAINESSDPATGDYLAAEVERMILEYAGFDGVIDRTVSNKFGESSGRAKPMAGVDHNTVHYVIFDPTQAKSAIGNRGTFSPNDADVTRSAARARFDTPETSRFDDLVYKLQDKHIDTKRVVDAVRAVDADLREDLDVYLQEELFHGRVAKRTEDFVHHELQPLVDAMRAKGLTVADLDEYLHARHAREANEVIAQRDPEIQDGGSGMLNQDAEAYFAGLPQDKRRALEEVSIQVDAMLRKTRDLLVSYELESRAKVQGWADMFEHYVPLMREDEGGHTGTGQGFSIRGKEVKSRTGSTRRVVDILANIAMQRERTIVRGEKNRVSQALFGLAALSPNEAFWDVDTHVPTEPVFNPATGLVEDRPDTMYKLRPNVVVAKFAGEGGTVSERAVVFNEKNERALRMAEALKNLDAAQLEGLLGASAKLTRYFASINTQYNPVFGVVNLIRDVQEAMVNLGSTELAGKRATIARATPRALAGIYSARRAERSGERSSSDWARLWDEFQRVGGQTGYRQLFVTSADRADAIRATLDPNAWMDSKLGRVFTVGGALKAPLGAAQRAAKWIFDWLSDYNEAMENGVRLAAYRVGLDAGLSKERAASVAKNLTVNFNRRGQAGQQAGALYAFFNASMQGTARVARTLFDMDPGKPKTIRLSKTGKKVVYGGMLLGSIQAFALAAAGFGDDDPPEWARQRNLIIPLGGKKYVSIPLPLGLLVIPSIGRSTTEWALGGFEDTSKRVEDMVSMFADAFNPIGNAGLSMQTLAPTALDPLVALTENRDWTGRPIARTSSNKAIPGHALARDTSTEAAQILSEAINTLSGGTRYTAGILSPTPDQIDYLAGQIGGGVWREVSKAEQTVRSAITGESLPPYKVPLLGRLFGSAKSQASEGNSFYGHVERLNRIETELKGLRRDGNTQEAAELRSRFPEAYLITQANYAERKVQKLRAKKRDLLRAGAPRERVKEIEDQITSTMASLNRAVEALQAN